MFKLRALKRTLASLLAIGALTWAALLAPATASPAQAVGTPSVSDAGPTREPGPYRIQNLATLRCLDQASTNWVEYQPCNSSDRGQRWIIWNGGFVKNQYTGLCLAAFNPNSLTAANCVNDTRLYWQFWTRGWFQSVYWGGTYGCMADTVPGTFAAGVGTCLHSTTHYWDVRIWP